MEYLSKVCSRLDPPGIILLAAGSLLVIFSERISVRLFNKHREGLSLAIKAVGGVLAIIGGLILLDLI